MTTIQWGVLCLDLPHLKAALSVKIAHLAPAVQNR